MLASLPTRLLIGEKNHSDSRRRRYPTQNIHELTYSGDRARKAGFEERASSTDPRDGLVRFPMAVDWDIVRDEIAGSRVPSVISAEFWLGNNSGGQQTLDRDYLARAEMTGHVKIAPLHQVTSIAETPAGGYTLACDKITEDGDVADRLTLTCDYLFLAAGCLGTTQLLMRARARGGLPHVTSTSATASATTATCS